MSSHICCECVCCYQDLAAAASTFLPLSVPYALIIMEMQRLQVSRISRETHAFEPIVSVSRRETP